MRETPVPCALGVAERLLTPVRRGAAVLAALPARIRSAGGRNCQRDRHRGQTKGFFIRNILLLLTLVNRLPIRTAPKQQGSWRLWRLWLSRHAESGRITTQFVTGTGEDL